MRVVLVSSRSFGKVMPVGNTILTEGGFEVRHVNSQERPLDEGKMTEIVAREAPDAVICGPEPITANVLEASKTLHTVMMHGVGVDHIDLATATRLGIFVANAPGANTAAVADLTIAAMLALLRHICQANQRTKAGGWERHLGHELGEMTVGVIGTGRIGAQVIRRLGGFGSPILAYDVIQDSQLVKAYRITYVSLEELLEESDIVTLHTPLIEETRKLIGRRELQRMKKSACLINTARGGLVDEDALYEHLKANQTAAAALDVFSAEPPRGNPLLDLENVLATPHVASYTAEATERLDRMCAETIVNIFSGKPSPNILNPEAVKRRRP
jgi:D-3-phosphoglycerate dehydrogenase